MTGMPTRQHSSEAIPLADDGLTVGKVPVRGAGLRVGMQANGQLVLMSPAAARRMAKRFDSPDAVAADLGWVADALREAAAEIQATPLPEQLRIADQFAALGGARGTRQ